MLVDPNNPNLNRRAIQIAENKNFNLPNVPVTLAEELKTNPFLRCKKTELRTQIGLENASNLEVFVKLRKMKDDF
jgi:hydroxyacylglutathione hydrolase